jgi:amino acid transporter/mannitol/fructose-specific phosphotransferase system IIA component (Ntr-type)
VAGPGTRPRPGGTALDSKLKRELGLLDVFCIATGAMISSGLFVLPGILFARVGPAVCFSYLIASVLLLPSLLSKAELATALPKAGGDYFFIDRSIGPLFGMLGGLAAWVSLAFKTAFALIGMGAFARLLWPGLSELETRLIALGLCVLFMLVNLWGAKHAGRLQVLLVAGLLALLAAYVGIGVGATAPARYRPLLPHGLNPLLLGAAMAFVSFGGLTKAASVAEEVKNPGRNLPLGMFAAYAVVTLVYVAAAYVTVGLVPADELAGSLTPLSLGGHAIWPRVGLVAMSIAALFAFVSTANAGILAASRAPLAMSRDGLLPELFGHVNERRGTPHYAVVFTALFIGGVLFLDIELFVKSASAMKILLFAFSMVSLILLRESRIASYQPKFRVPCYPWLYIVGIIAYAFLLVELGTLPLLITGGILGGGLAWYGLYARTHVVRESALTHLAKRIASRSLPSHDLEAELAEIVHERDVEVEDRFDRLVRECTILDLEGSPSRDEALRTVAEQLAAHLTMSADEVERLLRQREEATSTIIRPGLAIPHIVVEGTGRFDILLVRCREGVGFTPDGPPVHALFVLIGSADERNYHLRALMAVAEIVQNPHFDRNWRRARTTEDLRRLILVAQRRRESPLP